MKRFKAEAHEARKENIIDMGLTFSAMVRLFSSGSKEEMLKLLGECLNKLPAIESQDGYSKIHKEFCESFSKKLNTGSTPLLRTLLKRGTLCPRSVYEQAKEVQPRVQA